MILNFKEFGELNEKDKYKDKNKDKVHVDPDRLKMIDKRKKEFNQKWVCLIATDVTIDEFNKNHPGIPFDIRFGSHRILLNSQSQFERAKIKYMVGNIYKKEMIKQVNFHHYNPLIDSEFYG